MQTIAVFYFKASFSALPGVNFTVVEAGMGVLLPTRAQAVERKRDHRAMASHPDANRTHMGMNAYIERYNRTVRYDLLNQYLFESIEVMQNFATKWLWRYNNERPHMGIGGITPAMKMASAA